MGSVGQLGAFGTIGAQHSQSTHFWSWHVIDAAFGFASYTVAIRWNLDTPKFTTVLIAGLICALFSIVMLCFSLQSLEKMPIQNVYLSILHVLIVSLGFILYTFGAKFLPSA